MTTFSHVIIMLTALTRTAHDILNEISLGAVNLAAPNGTVTELGAICRSIISFDGQVNNPAVPAHIKENLPTYAVHTDSLRQQLADLIAANIDAFSPATRDVLKSDVARHSAILTDRFAR